MSDDARFEDGAERPLSLGAQDVDDLRILSALVQDAVFPISEIRWQRQARRLALLVNRVRREDLERARQAGRPVERVQSLLVFENVMGVASQGIDRSDSDLILQILALEFEPGPDAPGGDLIVTLAGDGAIRLSVEAPEAMLRDVTRPYVAPAGRAPDHGI